MDDLGHGPDELGGAPLSARDVDDRESLRRALGFPEPSQQEPTRSRRRRGHFAGAIEIAPSSPEDEVAPSLTGAELADSRERVDRVGVIESAPAWRGDLNQLYAALSERLRVHSEDVTRQLTDERTRLASLLATVVDHVNQLSSLPSRVAENGLAPDLTAVEERVLASVEEITSELTKERQGLVSVVCSIEEQLVDLRSMLSSRSSSGDGGSVELTDITSPTSQPSAVVLSGIEAQLADIRTALRSKASPAALALIADELAELRSVIVSQPAGTRPADGEAQRAADELRRALRDQLAEVKVQLADERAGRDAWLHSVAHRLAGQLVELNGATLGTESQPMDLEPVLAEVRALGRTVLGAASAMDRGPEMNELRELVREAAGKVLPEELAVLQRAISDLTEHHPSGIAVEAIADDLDTMRKEIDERLGRVESALDEIRAALRNG